MKKELFDKLRARHPKILSQLKDIGCDGGWYWLIDNLCNGIQWRCYQDIAEHKRTLAYNKMVADLRVGETTLFDEHFKAFNPSYVHEQYMLLCRADLKPAIPPTQVVVTQIKEKFGGLCFYVNHETTEIGAIISFAEGLSYHMCETCGTTVRVGRTNAGWIRTCCEECRNKYWPDEEWLYDEDRSNNVVTEHNENMIERINEITEGKTSGETQETSNTQAPN